VDGKIECRAIRFKKKNISKKRKKKEMRNKKQFK
jgi:hypothetical protein